MNLEAQKLHFANHVATFTDYGNIKILDFKNPNSSEYRIRFLFEEDYCRLHISGDLGELTATNYYNMTFDKFTDYVNDTGYFEEKVDCASRSLYVYDEDLARYEIAEYIKSHEYLLCFTNMYNWVDNEEHRIRRIINTILEDFNEDTGLSSKGVDILVNDLDCDLDCDCTEFVYKLGRKSTGILDLYMLAFKLATEQLTNGSSTGK